MNDRLWLLAALLLVSAGCNREKEAASTPPSAESKPAEAPSTEVSAGTEVTMPNGLKYQDLVVGTGTVAEAGRNVSVHYTGWLQSNNSKFDSSVDRGQPFQFQLGSGQVIKGWDEGVKGMKVGGKRKLTIPPSLGYGERGFPDAIPPNATLVFDVELIAVN